MTREDAINFLKSINKEDTAVCCDGALFTLDEYGVGIIDMAIEALKVDLVRCGECVHWYNDADTGTACEFTNMHEDADDFCSYGKRRSDD